MLFAQAYVCSFLFIFICVAHNFQVMLKGKCIFSKQQKKKTLKANEDFNKKDILKGKERTTQD